MRDTQTGLQVPIDAIVLDFDFSRIKGLHAVHSIEKLFKLANSSLPIDEQLVLPKIIFATELGDQTDFCEYWLAQGV